MVTMKVKKRILTYDAQQWFPGEDTDGLCTEDDTPGGGHGALPHIHYLGGCHFLYAGDWIIRGERGEVFIIKADMFDVYYEAV